MRAIKRIIKLVYWLFLICGIFAAILYCINPVRERKVSFKWIESYAQENEMMHWQIVRDHGYYPLSKYNQERNQNGMMNNPEMNDHDTYVICHGCTLSQLTYTLLDISGFHGCELYFFTKAYITPEESLNITNVYKTRKRNIEYDIHTEYGTTVVYERENDEEK